MRVLARFPTVSCDKRLTGSVRASPEASFAGSGQRSSPALRRTYETAALLHPPCVVAVLRENYWTEHFFRRLGSILSRASARALTVVLICGSRWVVVRKNRRRVRLSSTAG